MSQILDRDYWLLLRKNHIGASDAPVIMNGVHFEKTPFKLWEEKLGLRNEDNDSYILQQGRLKEEPARQLYEKLTGNLMAPEIVTNQHPKYKFMMATLDGLSEDGLAVEIKFAGQEDHEMAKNKQVPTKYYPQVQHQLACLDADLLHYFSFRNDEGIIVEVKRDEAFIEKLYQEEERFWNKVLNLEAPELTDKDYVDFNQCAEWKDLADKWKKTQVMLKQLEEVEKEYRQQLIAKAGNFSATGHGVRLTKMMRKGTVDYKAIPELQGLDLEPYRKKSVQCWRLGTIE